MHNLENNEELENQIQQSLKNWNPSEEGEDEFDAEEFFGDAGDAAQADIEAEYGKNDFTPFGTMEDPRMLKKFKQLHEEKELRSKIQKLLSESNIFSEDEESKPGEVLNKTPMFHCDAKSCDHYKDVPGTTNCILREISISAKGVCNQYEPVPKGDDGNEDINEIASELDEERIVNKKAKNHVNNLENFIGSHIYGEDLGGLGKMYVAYSYGEQFPVYVNNNGKWYHNTDSYIYDGEINQATEEHKDDMRPSEGTSGMSLRGLQSMISKFKSKNKIKSTNHKNVEPGEKN